VRNPLISGVLSILAGDLLRFASGLKMVLLFCCPQRDLHSLVEEPMLVGRFGHEYLFYKKHIRRWIPRLTPWNPDTKASSLANLVERAGSER
jgi:protein-S-isoprenylcysteine O-methyltransferase Ste14